MQLYIDWIRRLIFWDGILPLAVASEASVVNLCFRGQPAIGTVVALVLPIGGFWARLWIGSNYFQSTRHFFGQNALFCVAIFLLMLIDALLIVFCLEPRGIPAADWHAWNAMYATYFCLMAIAYFPRRQPPH